MTGEAARQVRDLSPPYGAGAGSSASSRAVAEIRLEVDVAVPVERTWAAATDWERQHEWILATRVRSIGGDGRGVGGRLQAVTGLGPLALVDTMEITEWSPPHAWRVRHTGRLVRGTGAFEVRERPGGSTFVWSERLDLPLGALGRLGWRMVRPPVGWGLRRSLRSFSAWTERG